MRCGMSKASRELNMAVKEREAWDTLVLCNEPPESAQQIFGLGLISDTICSLFQ